MVVTAIDARYVAFLSYSHRDGAAARALHRRLESYRIPRRLVATPGEHGPVPARLTPIFRDREELPAAGDLSAKVRAALEASGSLIVLCSPHAAASLWVMREIETFREIAPGRPILAAILDGEPSECFPKTLGVAQGAQVEPLAADIRASGDGRRLGFLKLVAGIAGVPLDALVQRDAARRIRRVTAVTLAAVVAMLVMAMLTIVALNARRDAERQRANAEGLVEFMLTDLRDKLDGEVRLQVLSEVNERALAHYAGQDLSTLGPDALERRARILLAMGEDDGKRGKRDRALALFREAHRTTAALLAAAPEDPARIFTHAQSEYWIGYNAFDRGNVAGARSAWQRYARLADQLAARNPSRRDWLKEVAFSRGNLCTVALQKPVDVDAALSNCAAALDYMERAAQGSEAPGDLGRLANRHAWLADALEAAGQKQETLRERQKQLALAERHLASDPQNATLRAKRLWAIRGLAMAELALGNADAATRKLRLVANELGKLVQFDPENAEWRAELEKIRAELSDPELDGER